MAHFLSQRRFFLPFVVLLFVAAVALFAPTLSVAQMMPPPAGPFAGAGVTPVSDTQGGAPSRPVLVISNSPVPKSVLEKTYNFPTQASEINPSELVGSAYYRPTETMVSRKLRDLKSELAILQDKVVILSQALAKLQRTNEGEAASYFAAVATINTQLQVGSTPGNPRLLERLSIAEDSLETLSERLADFNDMSIDASKVATEASFLLDSARATYGLSGAVEEDHVQLAGMEDKVNTMIVLVDRLLNTITDEISRTNSYLLRERDSLRTLSVAVANGSLYGAQHANRPFSGVRDIRQLASAAPRQPQPSRYPSHAQPAPGFYPQPYPAHPYPAAPPVMPTPPVYAPAPQAHAVSAMPAVPADPVSRPSVVAPQAEDFVQRPLVKIRFDRKNVAYEKPLHMAVNEVLQRYPDVSFNVLALHPSSGSAAETAIESTRAKRYAQKIVRALSDQGVHEGQVSTSFDASADIESNEVHVYIH